MAITKNAKKAIRTQARKRVFNVRNKSTLRETTKTMKTYLKEKKVSEATAYVPTVYQALDKAAKRGVIKPNTAARTKSRIIAQLRKIAA
jgi:small subunit ribosomal protein S20